MTRINFKSVIIINIVILSLGPQIFAGSISAKNIIRNVKKKYEAIQSLKADFKQVYTWELVGETQTLEGTLYLKTGNRYRIETESQIIVTDGNIVWTYSKSTNQVIIDLLNKSEENPLPKDLLFKYSEEYVPHLVGEEKIDSNKTYVLNLIPKDEEAFIKSMKIWVDASNWLTIKIEQVDINDNVNTYYVSDIEQNMELSNTLFTFQIPPDAEVVDLR